MENLKERFRKFAIKCDFADECVIDNPTYSCLPDITGCFPMGSMWIVYSTDERGASFNTELCSSEFDAYKAVARRFGFIFE